MHYAGPKPHIDIAEFSLLNFANRNPKAPLFESGIFSRIYLGDLGRARAHDKVFSASPRKACPIYDVGPARVFLGKAEKTMCGLGPAPLHRGSKKSPRGPYAMHRRVNQIHAAHQAP